MRGIFYLSRFAKYDQLESTAKWSEVSNGSPLNTSHSLKQLYRQYRMGIKCLAFTGTGVEASRVHNSTHLDTTLQGSRWFQLLQLQGTIIVPVPKINWSNFYKSAEKVIGLCIDPDGYNASNGNSMIATEPQRYNSKLAHPICKAKAPKPVIK